MSTTTYCGVTLRTWPETICFIQGRFGLGLFLLERLQSAGKVLVDSLSVRGTAVAGRGKAEVAAACGSTAAALSPETGSGGLPSEASSDGCCSMAGSWVWVVVSDYRFEYCRKPLVAYAHRRYLESDREPEFETDCWLESSGMIAPLLRRVGTTQRSGPLERAPLARDCFEYSNRPEQCQTSNSYVRAPFQRFFCNFMHP